MPKDNCKYDDLKRKLRELKKLEIKIRSKNHTSCPITKISISEEKNGNLIWYHFFSLSDKAKKNEKYSISDLYNMTKNEFKDVISEYFYHVYYDVYERCGLTEATVIDTELLTQLGLPIYANNTEIKKRFRELAKAYHPDNGGDSTKFIEIMEQYKSSGLK